MVATRRQSGHAPQAAKNVQEEKNLQEEEDVDMDNDSEDELEEYESESEEDEEESEESEWEEKPSRMANGKASGKRVKLSNDAGPKRETQQPKPKSRTKSLSLLLTVPLDILYEILSRLSPKDLVSLSRTNKPIRATLMTRQSITIWKAARENIGCPSCPSDFSEPKWAVLISGSHCQQCGAKNVFKVDFGIRRRVCVPCKKNNLVVASRFSSIFPTYDDGVLTFIPYTNVGGWAHGRVSSSKFYWKSDVHDTVKELAKLKDEVRQEVAGAKQNLQKFQLERMDMVEEVAKSVDLFENWLISLSSVAIDKRSQRYEAITAKFLALGYVQPDIKDAIQVRSECHQNASLSDRIWKRIQPILEPLIQERQQARIAAARMALIETRKATFNEVYKTYLKTLVPSQWFYHPGCKEVHKFPPVDQIISSADDVAVDAFSFAEVVPMLPELARKWLEDRRTMLRKLIQPIPSGSATGEVDPANLATTVFECMSTCGTRNVGLDLAHPLFTLEDAVMHKCKCIVFSFGHPARPNFAPSLPDSLPFSEAGVKAAAMLVSLAGLNPETATAATMDRRDARFFCSHCTPQNLWNGSFGRTVYTWRSAVAHKMRRETLGIESRWTLATPEETGAIKRLESAEPAIHGHSWTCNHCTVYIDDWKPRAHVIQHLKDVHNKTGCVEPRDLFPLPDARPRTPSFFKMSPPGADGSDAHAQVYCARCLPPHNTRIFKVAGVLAHLGAKHNVPNPIMGRDWVLKK